MPDPFASPDSALRRSVWRGYGIIFNQQTLSRWFKFFWLLSISLTVLDLGRNFGFGNFNPIERSVFLLAAVAFTVARPLRQSAMLGVALILISTFVSALYTDFPGFNFERYSLATVALLTFLLFVVVVPRPSDARFILGTVQLLPLALVGLGVLMYLAFGRPLMQADHTGAMRLGGAVMPAYLALACYAACVASCGAYAKYGRPVDAALLLGSVVVCTMSGSRTASVCCAVTALIAFLASPRSHTTKLLGTAYISIGATALLFTFGSQLLARITSGSTSGRDRIWGALLQVAEQYPVLGIGFGHHGLVVPAYITKYTGTAASHNEFIRLYTELGAVGVVIFSVGFLLIWFGGMSKRIDHFLLRLGLFIGFLGISSTDNTLFATYALLALVAGILVVDRLDEAK